MKACVIIPTYNEGREIAKLVREIRQKNLEVLVIDDGSTDNTAQIAQGNGATVIRNNKNEGKGASLVKGFNYALSKKFDAVVAMDGDGQHLVEDVPLFLNLAGNSKSGILIGNRMLSTKNMPLSRFLTNFFMSVFISFLAKQRIPDTQCGFRLIKKEVLERVKLATSKYETESEILIRASRLGFKIHSVPIKTVYSGSKSQINPFIDTLRFIRFIIKDLWTTQS
jgi:glycosyltransferase involved in cell wall biosynthesis